MTDAPDNLTLQLLGRLDEKVDRVGQRLDDLVTRVGSLEQQTAALRTDMVRVQVRMDHFDPKLMCIERRLDLIDA